MESKADQVVPVVPDGGAAKLPPSEEAAGVARWLAEVVRQPQHPYAEEYQRWRQGKNSSPALPHRYKRLSRPDSIRLFRLFDVDLEAREIIGVFFEERLGRNTMFEMLASNGFTYTALSYTWGSALEDSGDDLDEDNQGWKVLICDLTEKAEGTKQFTATSLPIGANLAAFLRALVGEHARKGAGLAFEVWIDAICINQDPNSKEKPTQVLLMGDIYREASNVFVWMGQSERDWKSFLWVHDTLYPALTDLRREHGEGFWEVMAAHDPTRNEFWTAHLPSLRPPTGTWASCWEAYWRFFFERRWFRRAWTFQEALLANELIVVCGEHLTQVSFNRLGALAYALDACRWRQLLSARFPHPKIKTNPNKMVMNLYTEMHRLHKYIVRVPLFSPRTDIMDGKSWLELWRLIVGSLRMRESFLDEDRVNASFGIAKLTRPPDIFSDDLFLEVEGMKPAQIYTWMSGVFLTRSGNLDHLSEVGGGSASLDIPLWVADFSRGMHFEPLTRVERFDAFPYRYVQTTPATVMDNALQVYGVKVCTIKAVGGRGDRSLPGWILRWLSQLPDEYPLTKKPQSGIEAVWRTTIWDSDDSQEPADSSWGTQFKAWLEANLAIRFLLPLHRIDEEFLADDWWDDVKTQLRRIQITTSLSDISQDDESGGCIGLCSQLKRILRQPPNPDPNEPPQTCIPSLSTIESLIFSVQSHPDWSTASAISPPLQSQPWDSTLAAISSLVSPFSTIYNTAYQSRFARRIAQTFYNRTFFTTESGYIGVGRSWCEPGDEVWLLCGGRVPYVLQSVPLPITLPEGLNGPKYFKGDCYVHGIMEGEYVLERLERGHEGRKLFPDVVMLC